jgi:signal transduction histidine kinase
VEQLQTRAGNRQTVITSSRVVNGLQVQVLRDETELEGVRRARDTVLANIGHEFRTPLAAQLASIELLRDGIKSAPPEKLEELVFSLERGTLRLTRLIDNLLESVRIESGQLDVRRQSIELADVIEDARGLVDAAFGRHRDRHPVERDACEAGAKATQIDLLTFAVGARDLHARDAGDSFGKIVVGQLAHVLGRDRIGEVGRCALHLQRLLEARAETGDDHLVDRFAFRLGFLRTGR